MTYPGGEHDPYSGQPVPHYYGSGSTYQGLGAFEQPPRRSRTALVAGVVTALVLAGGGAAAYFLTTGGDESPEAAPATSTSAAPTTAQSSSPPPTSSLAPPTTQSAGSSRVKAVVEGWAPVFSAREGAAFDVSEDWTVEDPGVIAGFEDDSGIRTAMHGVATYRDGFCAEEKNSNRGRAGFMSVEKLDPKKVARAAAKMWATAAMELPEDSPKVKPTPAQEVEIHGGKRAWLSTATVDNPEDGPCQGEGVKVTTVAFQARPGGLTVVFVLYHDTGVDDELPEDEARRIIGSLRVTNK
ncbi:MULTISPECIES: hypothetical protein [Thermocrispum]|jgi:hypothetical protein|uniref:DUF8017 domain-containing protein n=1 Tax=Thermocrispum agreste TaxID=37925 RepID=A0ABD6FCS5_9PSEU|nr:MULTISPECIES: hypothetical protein [Thermocrispum]